MAKDEPGVNEDMTARCGANAYGADAVAGVVNIKFRYDYRGAETDVEDLVF